MWEFTCETLVVVIVECVMAYVAWTRTVHTLQEAIYILLLFPGSLLFVWVGTHVLGLT